MKKINYIKIFLGLILIVSFSACKNEMRMPEMSLTALPKITKEPNSDVLIEGGVLYAKFKVDMFYTDLPKESKLVVVMNQDYANPKVIKSITTFPSVENLTDVQLKTLFGISQINAGDQFDIGLDILMNDDKWYPAFGENGPNYGSGVLNLPNSSPVISYRAVCKFAIDEYVGTASITDPFWYEGTYAAAIEKVDATNLKIKKFAEFAGDVTLTINPDHTVTVPKQVYDTNLAAWGLAKYTNPAVAGSGTLDACTKTIKLTLAYTVDQGGFGNGNLTIKF